LNGTPEFAKTGPVIRKWSERFDRAGHIWLKPIVDSRNETAIFMLRLSSTSAIILLLRQYGQILIKTFCFLKELKQELSLKIFMPIHWIIVLRMSMVYL
jgi:hypothetical protein